MRVVLDDERRRGRGRRGGRSRCRRRGRRGACEWPPSRPSARLPWRSASKRTPSALERRGPRRGASSTSTCGGAAAGEAAAGGLGVGEVLVGRVVDGERGGDPALRPVARGLRERGGGDERDARARARGGERGEEPGAAGADHGDVGVDRAAGMAGYRSPRAAGRPALASRPRSSTTPARIPSAPRGSRAIERELDGARLARLGARARRPRRRATLLERGPSRRRTSTRSSAFVAAGGGALDADTIASRGHVRGGAARRGRRGRGGRRCCSAARRRSPRRCTARPGHHAEARAGDGLLPLQQRRGRGAARARRARRSRGCSSSTGTSTTATGRTTSSTRPTRCCS